MARSSLLFLLIAIARASFPTEALVKNCTAERKCKEIVGEEGLISANCTISNITELSTFIAPSQVKTLIIALSSEIKILPEGSFVNFTNLVNLSISNNYIRVIRDGAFSSLNLLQYLDLSANQLTKWEGSFSGGSELSSLTYLDISSNPTTFKLPTAILGLPSLKEIHGAFLNQPCSICTLIRNYTWQREETSSNRKKFNITTSDLRNEIFRKGKQENCQVNEIEIRSKEVVEYARHGFFPTCLEKTKECYDSVIRVTPIHKCWDSSNKYLNAVFFISPIAFLLNLTVVLIVLTTRALRRNVTLFLTCNMAFSDLILSLYAIILLSTRQKSYVDFLMIQRDMCNIIGFMWLTCQIVSIKTSLILTVERFLAVVYCMEPTIRITRKLSVALAALVWILGVAVAILPLLKISVYYSNTYCIPMRPIKDIPHSYELSVGLSLWGMLIYCITIPFYVKIFLAVKKTSKRAGVKRDGTLAKRICILVLSNMLFFFFPIVIAFLWLTTDIKDTMSPKKREILTGVFPTLLFSLNSLINPLLYAFRSEKFQKAIKIRIYTICLRKPRSSSLSMSLSHLATLRTTRNNRNSKLPSSADTVNPAYTITRTTPPTPKRESLNGDAMALTKV